MLVVSLPFSMSASEEWAISIRNSSCARLCRDSTPAPAEGTGANAPVQLSAAYRTPSWIRPTSHCQSLQNFGYVTANGPFIHKHNRLFTKNTTSKLLRFVPVRDPTTVLMARLNLRTSHLSSVTRELLCLVAVPDRTQIVVPPRTRPVIED